MSRRRILSERLKLSRDALWAACRSALSSQPAASGGVDVQTLEQRILYSASPLAVAAEAIAEVAASAEASADQQQPTVATEKVLVFVDSAVENESQFLDRNNLASPDQDVEFHVLAQDADGIQAISDILADQDQVAAIHIVSHGEQGQVRLGNATLDASSLKGYAGSIARWGHALTSEADILFYGCDVAGNSEGQFLLDSLAELTTADVAGSTDTTGHTALGGDWELEYHVGAIQATSAYSAQFQTQWLATLDAKLLFTTRPGNATYDNGVIDATPDGAVLGRDPSFTSTDFFDINPFTASSDPDIDAIHFVSRDITAAGVDLQKGDLLLSTADSESLSFTIVTPSFTLGGALAVNDNDLLLFRPHTPGDYTAGAFSKLLTDPLGQDLSAVTLVEQRTPLADVTLEAGTFLLAGKDDFNLYHYTPTGNVLETLILGDGTDPEMNFGSFVDGIALIDTPLDLGGINVSSGQLLITLADAANIGSNDLSTKDEDAFILTLTSTVVGSGSATGSVDWLLDASKVGSGGSQEINGLAVMATTISGTIYEDINGDSDLSDAVGVQGVTVHLYEDDGDGVLDDDDSLVDTTTTASDGRYAFDATVGVDYFVTVDSRTITPDAGFESGFDQGDVWAVQTYGGDTAFVANGSGGTEQRTGPGGYGGRRANTSDDADSADSSEHVASAAATDSVDFAFSFNVVTNTLAGDSTDSVQGSLRQFIVNANAIAGENVMRFVPVEAPSQSDGGDRWWRLNVTELLPRIEGTFTTIDGTAYSFLDGTNVRNTVTALVGNVGAVGLGDDAVANSGDETILGGVEGSELEIVGDLGSPLAYGLATHASDTTLRNFSLRGFQDLIQAGTGSQASDRIRIENAILGAGPTATNASIANKQPAATERGLDVRNADDGVIHNSIIVNANREGINLDDAQSWTITNNVVQHNAISGRFYDGIRFDGTTTQTLLEHNFVAHNSAGGIDFNRTNGDNSVIDNSVLSNGFGGSQTFGIRVWGNDNQLTNNLIEGNAGVGIEVGGEATLLGFGTPAAIRNTISRNSFSDNGGQAIDLQAGQTSSPSGIDEIDGYDDNDANRGLDFPELQSAEIDHVANTFSLSVLVAGNPKLEVYRAATNDPSDQNGATGDFHGEGQTYLATLEHNGTEYVATHFSGETLGLGEQITVLAIDSDGNTSEFSANLGVQFTNLPSLEVSNDVHSLPENTNLASRLKVADLTISGSTATSTLVLEGANASFFEIDGGALYLKAGSSFNFETKSDYSIDIKLTDSQFTGHEETTNFAFGITDVNEPPSVSLSNRVTSLSESTDTSSPLKVADLNIADDALGTFTLSLTGDDASLFEISGTELFLRSATILDFESNPQLDVQVVIQDPSLAPSTAQQDSLTVALQDVNEAPSVSLQNEVTSLAEDTDVSVRRKVADIAVTDDALGAATLSLSGLDQDQFEIVGTELFLRAGMTLDHETQDQLRVAVNVRDPSLDASTAVSARLRIDISDVNEPPSVSLQNTITTVSEDFDTTNRTRVADILVADDALGTSSLGLVGVDAASFEIVGSALFLRAGAVLDHEANPALDVQVTVQDPALPADTLDSAGLRVSVTDTNEPPSVSLQNTTNSLPEDTTLTSNLKVADIVISDDALGTNSLALTGVDAGRFSIVGSELFLNAGTVLDHETASEISVTVTVRDTSLPISTLDSASLSIVVSDVNEAPSVELQNTTLAISEDADTSSATKVADIVVVDDALGSHTLRLTGGDAGLFSIVGNELFLNAGVSLDHESRPVLEVQVVVRDASLPAATEQSAALTLNVSDANDPPTVSLQNSTTTLSEDADTAFTTKVADIAVTDDALGSHSLSLTGADASLFTILGNELFLNAGVALDHETNDTLEVTVNVQDPSLPVSTVQSADLTIAISDVNEPPTIALLNPLPSIIETVDTSSATKVADIQVTDDALGSSTLSLAGPDAGLFNIVGTELFLNSGVGLDHIANPSLDVQIIVRDTSLPAASQQTADYSLAVLDVNTAPSLALSNAVLSISENANTSSRTKLADLVVTDDGSGTNSLSLSGADASLFEIDGTELFLRPGTTLDAVLNPSLDVTVEVRDFSLPAATQQTVNLSVSVLAVNDPPIVTLDNQVATLAENTDTSAAIKVADIVITDDAQGTATLSLSGADQTHFQIVGAELFLRSGVTLDFENQDHLDVRVEVRDPTLPATTSTAADYSLSVSDENEPPSLAIVPSISSLGELTSLPADLKVADLVVRDDALGTPQLQLSGANAHRFEIVGSELFLKSPANLDFETEPSLDVRVTVQDPALPVASAASELYTLSITDQNDPPTVRLDNMVSELDEDHDTSARTKLADIIVEDDALGSSILTLSGTNAGLFEIAGTELYLQAGAKLDFETLPKIEVRIEVSDPSLSASSSTSADYVLQLRDNAQAPTLQLTNTLTSLPEDQDTSSAPIRLADIVLIDDDGNHSYTLSGLDASTFEVKDNSLFLRQNTSLDFDLQDSYQVTIQVDDDQIAGSIDSSVRFTLAISDVNRAPTVSLTRLIRNIDENSDTSSPIHVADIHVEDDVSGTNTLGLSGRDAALFQISGTQLLLNSGVTLDAETADSFRVQVHVADSSTGESDFARYQLLVNDINEAPVFSTAVSNIVLQEDTQLTVDVTGWVSDEDVGDRVSVQLIAPEWLGAELDVANRELRFTPNADANGVSQIRFIAEDSSGAIARLTLPVEVEPVNDTVLLEDKLFVQSDSEKIEGSLLASTTDPDGEDLKVELVTAPTSGSLDLNPDGTFTFTSDGTADKVQFQVLVNDGVSPSNLATIEIQPLAQAPIPTSSTPEPPPSPPEPPPSTPEPAPSAPPAAGPIENDDDDVKEPRGQIEEAKDKRERGTLSDSDEPSEGDVRSLDANRNPPRSQETWVVLRQTSSGQDSILLSLEAERKGLVSEATVMLRSTELWKELDSIRENVSPASGLNSLALGTVSTATSSFLVGYLFWTIRSGLLLSSVMAALPTWQMFDPLAIVANGDEEDGESLQDIVDQSPTPNDAEERPEELENSP